MSDTAWTADTDGDRTTITVYPELDPAVRLRLTTDEALALGQWLVKTFGSGRTCNMRGCARSLDPTNESGYCMTHRERTCTAWMAKHRTSKALCPICRKGAKS